MTKIASPKAGGIAIAGVALVVLIGAVAFSKRKKEAFGGGETFEAAAKVTASVD